MIQRLQNLLRCSACRQLALEPEHETNDLGDSFVVFGWDHVVDLNASIERLRQRRILDDGYAGLTREFTNADYQVIHALGNEHGRDMSSTSCLRAMANWAGGTLLIR